MRNIKDKILFIQLSECDFCDETKPTIHYDTLGNNISIICKDCLQALIAELNTAIKEGECFFIEK